MKKRTVALLVVLTIVLSGAAGFGGAYLVNILDASPQAYQENVSSTKQIDIYDFDKGQLNAFLDNYFTSTKRSDMPPNGVMTLNNTNDEKNTKQLTVPEIAAITANSVVEIYTELVVGSGRMRQFVTEGAGSGVIVTADGYVVTNNHVIEGARKITVRLSGGADHEAELIGRDEKTDLAVIKINATGLQPVVYGDSDKLVAGELAVAVGNPLGKLGGSVTEGIISALSRNIEIDGHMMTLLQTSAAVNPGNSGGGLFNCHGELIGVVNAKSSGSDIEGIGFAIPVNLAKSIAESLIKYGYIPGRIDFNATLVDILDPMTAMLNRVQTMGVYVSQAGIDSELQPGDYIVSIDGKEISSTADINELLDSHEVGDVLSIVVSRNRSVITVNHTLIQAKA